MPLKYIRHMYRWIYMLATLVMLTQTSCNRKSQAEIDDEIITSYLSKHSLQANKTASGLYYIITKSTSDRLAKPGDVACMNYTGKFMDDSQFDSNSGTGTTFKFLLGAGQVIRGWDEGVALMHKGETARLFLPSALAYGKSGNGLIGPNAVLQFDVELVDLK